LAWTAASKDIRGLRENGQRDTIGEQHEPNAQERFVNCWSRQVAV